MAPFSKVQKIKDTTLSLNIIASILYIIITLHYPRKLLKIQYRITDSKTENIFFLRVITSQFLIMAAYYIGFLFTYGYTESQTEQYAPSAIMVFGAIHFLHALIYAVLKEIPTIPPEWNKKKKVIDWIKIPLSHWLIQYINGGFFMVSIGLFIPVIGGVYFFFRILNWIFSIF